MPLLNRKKVPLSPAIPYNPKRKRKEVWYLRFTNEVFTSYEAYINKLTLYQQAIWECEVTGRKNLTYEQALESEKTKYDRVEYKFCPALRKFILKRVQNQTLSLEELVKDIFDFLDKNYIIDEIVQCQLNNYEYLAQIVNIILPSSKSQPISTSNSETEEDDVPRQPNGRLRFPDAFLHPAKDNQEDEEPKHYEVQLMDDHRNPLENLTRIVEEQQICRDKFLINPLNIQMFIRECCYKDAYYNSPWLIREPVATANGLETRSTKKRKLAQTKTTDEKEAAKRARKEVTKLQKALLKEEKQRRREEKKKQAAIKYPLEDLDLPIYRKNPDGNWDIIDMAPHKYDPHNNTMNIPFPKAGRPDRPIPRNDTLIPADLFDSFLSIWTFMTVFAEPLKISAFSVDEFEEALFHTTHQPKATVLVEYNACLLNVIIKERDDDTLNETINGDLMEQYVESLEENKSMDDNEHHQQKAPVLPRVERGWRDKECLRISQKWDHKVLRVNYDRRGWETSLIGCLNHVATPDLLPNVDELLQHLVPKVHSTAADREKQYPTLSAKQKLDILQFLVDIVNESVIIKNYMEYCQEQLAEFRKQKSELKKEIKAVTSRRIQLHRRERQSKSQERSDGEDDDDDDDDDDSEDNSEDSDNSHSESDVESDSSESRTEHRQAKSKQKEIDRLHKKHHTYKSSSERQKLEEEEKLIKQKEKQLEKTMRRYMTLRIRPLGRDRFNNQYIYLDNIGVSNTYGSGRLYIHNPSDADIQLMMERDYVKELPEVPWGYGGGRWFIKKLMHEQGFIDESAWLENRMDELSSSSKDKYMGWWKYYSEPDELEQLIEWLNPKGIRELKLKNELIRLQPFIIESMQKRAQALVKPESMTQRTRARTAANNLDTWSKSNK